MQEDLDELKDRLGSDLGELFYHVKWDLIELRMQWRAHRMFFGTNQERVELLNSISGYVAFELERTLFEATLLGLRRLTDKPGKRGGKKSVSIKGLTDHFQDSELLELKRLINNAERAAQFARNWADKKIAHSDFEHRTGAMELQPASRQGVEAAIDAIASVVKWVSLTKLDTHQVTHTIPNSDDELWFLKTLYEGGKVMKEKENLSRQYSRNGNYEERDDLYRYPDWLQPDEQIFDLD